MSYTVTETVTVSWFDAAEVGEILKRHQLTIRKRGLFRVSFTITGRVDVVATALGEVGAWSRDGMFI